MKRASNWLLIGALCGLVSVALGAFGAHGLKGQVDPQLLANWQTGASYLGLHAAAILTCGLVLLSAPEARSIRAAAAAFLIGALLFSGSLFVMTLTGLRQLGMITPIGGISLLAGWALLALGAWRLRDLPR
ncbi:DUF423 domain-containing protein [Thiorhodococcus mannitoliphagus]|uniref:DUF423 domain-containing protein n=1 Tax=Thiorhodococcus mannitoliphagus TaxID=329406 RepID=A0A6P1DXR8_9GAMM|nr:DUF423 domain-containing protein [Thiorhodococcus mannitoliphagus]NEX22270.1 DUF423 domain-containing protein [Thiorhodococcus mannitoliphagus]